LSILLNRYPKNYLIHLDMGGIALLMERPQAAIVIYEDILRVIATGGDRYAKLDKATVENRMGVAYREQRNLPESVKWLRRALGESDATPISRVVSHLELGKTYDRLGQREQAIEQYRRVTALEDFANSRGEAREFLQKAFRDK
jgi:tetratricopeptide (TPR) repeat protein